ncbi:MAG: NADH:ubiquinone oxidoreductase chain I-like protein [Solidesulfovibrio magneticus str. Maddingley MBC34]|uniref:NADH:ubiquinone oxidoreductase chain I-like protein n=1 Tax=Solidesulfovibrio magneticus str. Maddingley MBC34 TaxID=1206767 RepID=K6GW63_9BACT|nr:MAG: NADH:ubiquinone oxidoreductase chain I-like protein [Solidesulfovibrio magneticus str. Maddingley MBC34]
MSVSELFEEAYTGLKSLFVGLGITGKAFCQPQVTVIYPKQEVDNLSTFRGHVELVGKEDDPSVPRCVACGACVKACPSDCLSILCPVPVKEGQEDAPVAMGPAPQKGSKTPGAVFVDFALCSLCGQCAKTCPVDSLRFSDNPYMVALDRKEFRIDLMARLKRQAEEA